MQKSNTYRLNYRKAFGDIRKILLEYAGNMVVKIDQEESLYLCYPKLKKYKEKSGQMFAALQITDHSLDFYLHLLIDNPSWLPPGFTKENFGFVDPKGVMHLAYSKKNLLHQLRILIKIASQSKPAKIKI